LENNYSEYLATLKDISYNDAGKKYFIDMDFKSLHFDKIPAFMVDGYENSKCCSVDTLIYCEQSDTLYLIEFKENWPKKSGSEIRLKCYDSISKLCLFWTNILNKSREDFFKLNINYCLITRSTHSVITSDFLSALNSSKEAFQLKMLENTIVNKTRIFVTPSSIFSLLSRITKINTMTYIQRDSTEVLYSNILEKEAV